MTIGEGVKEGDFLWLLKEGTRAGFKLLCSHCRGAGTLDELTKPCYYCVGKGHVTSFLPFIEILGSVKVEACKYDPTTGRAHLSVLRPPLYLLDVYKGDIVDLCKDYWEDHDKGRSCSGAYRVGVSDSPLLHRTLEEAKSAVYEMNMKIINDACDQEKTEPFEDPDDALARIARYATSDSVSIYKETAIEDALC